MKICPQCNRSFDTSDNLKECPTCNVAIVSVEEEQNLIGQTIKDEFTIKEVLGQGGMGTVFRAYQHSMERNIAVKVLKRSFATDVRAVKRFYKEAKAASRLKNPHTIVVYDFGQTDNGLLYITMELLIGRSLQHIISQEGCLSVSRAVNILNQICQSLSEAHAIGMIHRDLKPDNVFISPQADGSEFAKVLDFGIAKTMGSHSTTLTADGAICGTPVYMSPEQALGQAVDHKSDIYSLGIILYQMITGKPPFFSDTPMGTLYKHVHESPSPLSASLEPDGIPDGLQELLDSMLAKDPEHRPGSVIDVQHILTRCFIKQPMVDYTALGQSATTLEGADISYETTGVSYPTPKPLINFGYEQTSTAAHQSQDRGRPGRWKWWIPGVLLGGLIVVAVLTFMPGSSVEDKSGRSSEIASAHTDQTVEHKADVGIGVGTPVSEPEHQIDVVDSTALHNDGDLVSGRQAPVSDTEQDKQDTNDGQNSPATIVTVIIKSDPDEATVLYGKKVLGFTPYAYQAKRSDEPVSLVLQKDGHAPRPISLALTQDNEILVKMDKDGRQKRGVRKIHKKTTKKKADPLSRLK